MVFLRGYLIDLIDRFRGFVRFGNQILTAHDLRIFGEYGSSLFRIDFNRFLFRKISILIPFQIPEYSIKRTMIDQINGLFEIMDCFFFFQFFRRTETVMFVECHQAA